MKLQMEATLTFWGEDSAPLGSCGAPTGPFQDGNTETGSNLQGQEQELELGLDYLRVGVRAPYLGAGAGENETASPWDIENSDCESGTSIRMEGKERPVLHTMKQETASA